MAIELLELGIMLVAMCGSLLILWNFKQVKRNHTSLLLDSDILHYSSDLYMNGGVLLSLIGTRFLGWWWLDSLSG